MMENIVPRNRHETKLLRKAMTFAESELRLHGHTHVDDAHVFKCVTFVDYRARINHERFEQVKHEHFKTCYMGDKCDGSCNDYGCS